ncbi:MAG: hypothetical protein CMA08_01120 [Euryarchaeota archaeon]|nr:hypothetical protein [Euryarchaeota archaeon]OUX22963.1 MAG: hypothetical protein CBE12_01030 [Euryarchaeota archaeon TMED252]
MQNRHRHVEVPRNASRTMRRPATAVALVLTMLLAGCVSLGQDSVEPPTDDVDMPTVIETPWILALSETVRNPVAGDVLIFEVKGGAEDHLDAIEVGDVRTSLAGQAPLLVNDVAVSNVGALVIAIEAPTTGVLTVSVDLHPVDGATFENGSLTVETNVAVRQAGIRIMLPVAVYAEEGQVAFSGHLAALQGRPASDLIGLDCTGQIDLGPERGLQDLTLNEDHAFSLVLSEEGLMPTVMVSATCVGPLDTTTDERSIRLILSEVIRDSDGDGVHDELDRCPNGIGEAQGWESRTSSDHDGDGCRDRDEDDDDDDDGLLDAQDACTSETGWRSSPADDYDGDGCRDSDEDEDDDNDGRLDVADACPLGTTGWTSYRSVDWDLDGCMDSGEDLDDDDDFVPDMDDSCPKGESAWVQDNTTDWDQDGCLDRTEDEDDDNDGVNDADLNGTVLDLCPQSTLGSEVDEFGCAADQRDSDDDGVVDTEDLCPGTPSAEVTDNQGCEDVDIDGVHKQNDLCPNSPGRWTIDENGCAVVQLPVPWTSTQGDSAVSGPFQTVGEFTAPTLDGSLTFSDLWDGNSTYLFLLMKTSGSSSSSSTFTMNPGTLTRNLPDDTHLVYGSYDSTYRSQITDRRADVQQKLNAAEEAEWSGRIHYLDLDLSGAGGDLGEALSALGEPTTFGIDRFQRLRQTGSTYTWGTSSTTYDPQHMSHEAWMWHAEHPAEIRRSDPGIEAVDLMLGDQHQGGWGGGFSTAMNATISLNHALETYDTMEMFHEHACSERRDRYQTSSGYAGCHEWDFEANLRICDRDNSSKCGTEFARWITTYGREGRWLTDLSPYLFMFEDGEDRRFTYRGANGGSLTITLLFSRWGETNVDERPSNATFAFTGGQFNGSYNDPALYERERTLQIPADATRVRIVATITGHGFQKDDANCAEFCDHEHHFTIGSNTAYEWHPIVYSNTGCEQEVPQGVVANQFGSWPYGRAGWCAGQDVKQWTYDITNWVTPGATETLSYRGLFNGAEYVPTGETENAGRNIHAEIWVVYDTPLVDRI